MNNDVVPAFVHVPTFSEMVSLVAREPSSDAEPFRIAVLRNIVVEPIEVPLKYFCRKANRRAVVRWGEFDTILQDSLKSDGPVRGDTDAVLVFCNLQMFAPGITGRFVGLSRSARDDERRRILAYLTQTVGNIRRINARCPVFLHTFESPVFPALGTLDASCPDGQSAWLDGVNRELREMSGQFDNCFCLSTDAVVGLLGVKGYYDPRYWAIGRAPYSRDALVHLAFNAFKVIYNLLGKTRKCLVLDCDNLLWGGIVGEDGLAGIALGPEWPGSSFVAFQEALVELHHRGVVLALCSRNNEADVWDVFDRHPHMVLKREHISAFRIDWQDKATGITALADELNIGLDAMVFLDDSEFEIGLVKEQCPAVDAITMPKDTPLGYATVIRSYGFFDTVSFSSEDRSRGEMYRVEAERRKSRQGVTLETYLASLQMTADVRLVDELSRDRAAQQTQKTNQFNLTTRRYTSDDIARLSAEASSDVIVLTLKDKFGDYGQVGTAIVRYERDAAIIDTLLLSCRALGRGVEDVFLAKILEWCARRGMTAVRGRFIPSARNAQVASFYPERRFVPDGERPGAPNEESDGGQDFILDLTRAAHMAPPPWFDVVGDL